MKKRSRRKVPFIAVVPASLLMACTTTPPLPGNPPEKNPRTNPTSTTSPEGNTISKNPPDPGLSSAESKNPRKVEVSYGKRVKHPDGKCTVEIITNPPYQQPVNCYAAIEPAPPGDKWCRVESADNPRNKIPVDCASPDLKTPVIHKNPPLFMPVNPPKPKP